MHGYGVACFTAKCRRRAAAPRAPLAFYILDVPTPGHPSSALSSAITLSLSFSAALHRPALLGRSLVAASYPSSSSPPALLSLCLPFPWRAVATSSSRALPYSHILLDHLPSPHPAHVRAYIDRPCTRTRPLPAPRSFPLAMHAALRLRDVALARRRNPAGLHPVCFPRVAARRELNPADANVRARGFPAWL